MIKDLSLNVIKDIKDADCFLIDGDHNWYTVYNELKAIYETYGEERFPLVFFHDILWPYDRRDLYYCPDNIPGIYRHEYDKKAMRPDSKALCNDGINENLCNAKVYGGEKNGVLTAIEDFVRDYPSLQLKLLTHDVLFGLGVIASEKKYPKALEYFTSFETLKKSMQLCENERVYKSVEIRKLSKKLKSLEDGRKKINKVKIYPDFGDGYSESTAVTAGYFDEESGLFYGSITFENTPVGLRLDPAEGNFCVVDNLYALSENGVIEPKKINGETYGSAFFFTNNDPQIFFENANKSREFRFKAAIYPFESMLALELINKFLEDNKVFSEENSRLCNENSALSEVNDKLSAEKFALSNDNIRLDSDNHRLVLNNEQLAMEKKCLEDENRQIASRLEEKSAEAKSIKQTAEMSQKKLSEAEKKNTALAAEISRDRKAIAQNEAVIKKDREIAEKLFCRGRKKGMKYALKFALKRGLFSAKTNLKAIKEIRKNGGFDVLYYCSKNSDVIRKGMDPLVHFIWFGGYEGRNPSEQFDVKKYLDYYDDVKRSGANPYAHYLMFGKYENRLAFQVAKPKPLPEAKKNNAASHKSSPIKQESNKAESKNNAESSVVIRDFQSGFTLRSYGYSSFAEQLEALREKVITIIVPIYNAYEETCQCIESVMEKTKFPYKLMLINDCSTDSRIAELMSKYDGYDNVIAVNNEKNLGFVGTVNYGLTHTENDVVLLNSDTRVTEGWLRKLAIAAYHNDNVATVTPFSNAAGAFSVPDVGKNEEIPEGYNLDEMAALVERCSTLDYVNVPTGNGFCMYVTRKAINAVGILDIETFSRGYGEENDFCMRAKEMGFSNIVADDTYIYHKRSASFKEEKQQLILSHRKILDERYPTYSSEIKIFSSSEKLIENRSRIKASLENHRPAEYRKKRVLYLLHEGMGGTVKTNEDLMRYAEKCDTEVFMLTSNANQMKLYSFVNGELNLLKTFTLKKKWCVTDLYVSEYADIYFDVFANLHLDMIHIRHLFKHSFDAVNIAHLMNIPMVLSFHDFYFICPTINLVNSDGKYCAAECRQCDTNCPMTTVLIKVNEPTNKWAREVWQKEISEILKKISAFVTTSEYAKQLYVKIYPEINDRFHVIEHGRDFEYDRKYLGKAPENNKIVILLAGNIGVNKGSEYIKQLIAADKNNMLEFHCIGGIKTEKGSVFERRVIYHGKYVREDFAKLVSEIKPAYVGIFSIWPETYCHVLTEAWSCGIPCIVSDIGTLRERALKNGGCIRADLSAPQKTYEQILEISFSNKYRELCNEVQCADVHSIARMGTDYIALYHKIISGNSDILVWLNNFTDKKVASSYIRVVSPIMKNPFVRDNMAVAELHNIEDIPFDSTIISKFNVFIQREKISDDSVDKLIKKCDEKNNLEVIFELDDDLLSIDKDHPEYEVYKNVSEKVKKIAKISSRIIVTNNYISDRLGVSGIVIPNYIDESIWKIKSLSKTLNNKDEYKILYFGTISHKIDLEIMKAPIAKLNKELMRIGKKATLFVIGCERYRESWYETIPVPKNSTEYPEFAMMLQKLEDFDIGVAPLDLNNKLNYSKSGLKYLEYTALGLPCICTNIKPYSDIIVNNETAILVNNNSADEWASAMFEVLTDISFRKQMIVNAQEDIKKNYMLSNHYKEIADKIFE